MASFVVIWSQPEIDDDDQMANNNDTNTAKCPFLLILFNDKFRIITKDNVRNKNTKEKINQEDKKPENNVGEEMENMFKKTNLNHNRTQSK